MNRDHISLKLPRDERSESEEEFTMYVMDISYFSGKLESYFNYQVTFISPPNSSLQIDLMKRFGLQGFKWKRVEPSWVELGKLKQQTGTSQVKMMLVRRRRKKMWEMGLLGRLKQQIGTSQTSSSSCSLFLSFSVIVVRYCPFCQFNCKVKQ